MKYVACTILGLLIGALACVSLISASLHYPDSWAQVSFGQTRAEVTAKIPPVLATDMKGDFWEAPCAIGFWQMQVAYDEQQRVAFKQLVLYVGTKQTFKAFHFL
jgi:hypothetical protein